jgi:hypothetical protein
MLEGVGAGQVAQLGGGREEGEIVGIVGYKWG